MNRQNNSSDTNEYIEIEKSQYEYLLGIKTRVDVVVEQILNEGYVSIEYLLRTLGTQEAVAVADELRKMTAEEEILRLQKRGG